jgi:hypothetical protein
MNDPSERCKWHWFMVHLIDKSNYFAHNLIWGFCSPSTNKIILVQWPKLFSKIWRWKVYFHWYQDLGPLQCKIHIATIYSSSSHHHSRKQEWKTFLFMSWGWLYACYCLHKSLEFQDAIAFMGLLSLDFIILHQWVCLRISIH